MDDSIRQTVRENQVFKEENERLKAELDDLKRNTIPKLLNVLERANKYGIELQKELKIAKSEAVKEFAERLKNATMPITLGGKYKYDVITKEGIDNLVKEMGCSDAE